ncbi:hypothetical protein HPB48_013742 [Haemaphysalis longicornis]|uniref:SANT domain-containing protein n=1 Tax=Haemaphysalis longicornis TaxID=44386 RepID=A0A9J6G085_HAELO|nr:hypothetical protein HPB48_013742 [Haemaphysalis longicornis]
MLHLKRKAQERQARADSFSASRNRSMSATPHEMGQKGSSVEWKANEQKQRQFFEEQFPELKKTLREQLRLSKSHAKSGKRKRMGADMQVILGLQEPAKEKRRKLHCAIIPPLLSGEQRPPRHVDFRNLVQDPLAELEERHSTNEWDDRDKEIFREMFIQHPKQFDVIASCLGRKSVADCVEYYYLSKKSEDYKQLTRKQGSRVTLRAPQRKTLASSVTERDHASSSVSSSLPTATSAMVMTEKTMIPFSPDAIPGAAATSGSGNAATPAPPLSQDKEYQSD